VKFAKNFARNGFGGPTRPTEEQKKQKAFSGNMRGKTEISTLFFLREP
jgi:hypothetical protein